MEEYSQEGVDALANAGKPIPGQSLTYNPDEARPFERPPEFTNFKEALDFTASELLLEENYMPLMAAIGDGVTIVDLAAQIGYVGFREGKWNPDLMLMLVEPLAYIIIALAERAGIDPVIYIGEEEDEAEEMAMLGASLQKERLENMRKFSKEEVKLPEGMIPQDIVQEIETLEPPESLLAPPTEESGLMARPSNEESV